MSPGISVSIHFWRGIGRDIQPDLFFARIRLGFVTLAVERGDLWKAYWKLRKAIAERVEHDRRQR
jgi:hypothetical protein